MSRILWLSLSCLPLVVQADVVGSVTMLSGGAWQTCGQEKIALQMKDDIKMGCRVVTDANGSLIIRMVDNAVYRMGAATVFYIEAYQYDPSVADNNRIKTRLEQGEVRAITGAAGEANKRMYRMNTPLTAIGIRGTDYTVSHGVTTLVEIHQGAVAVSPFNDACTMAGFGECRGAAAMVLDANGTIKVLEINSQGQVVVKKQISQTLIPEESLTSESKKNLLVDKRIVIEAEPKSVFEWRGNEQPVTDNRWQLVATNKHYGLYADASALPTGQVMALGNKVTMQLADADAQVSRGFGLYAPASVDKGSLQLDIAAGRFNTQLSGRTTDDVWSMSVQGQLSKQGQLTAVSDVNGRPSTISGVVNADATQAGYVFETLQPTGLVDGVTRWQIKR